VFHLVGFQVDKSMKVESVGAFQKLPMVMPSTDILYSALRKAQRVSPTKGKSFSKFVMTVVTC